MDYFSRPEVSNSDLTRLKEMLYPTDEIRDPTEAYRFGSLVDAMITEPETVNFLNRTHGDEQFTEDEFERARQMKRAFMNDIVCNNILDMSECQKVMVKPYHEFDYDIPFPLPVRCKWDLWMPNIGWGADIKSTTAKTHKEFEEAVRFFDYDRQRYFYMEIAGSRQDMIIGISKENFEVFKVPVKWGDPLWESGREKCLELAFKMFLMFHQ